MSSEDIISDDSSYLAISEMHCFENVSIKHDMTQIESARNFSLTVEHDLKTTILAHKTWTDRVMSIYVDLDVNERNKIFSHDHVKTVI